VSEKTSLTNVALSANCIVGEKARISNTVMMEGARVEPGAILQVRLMSIFLSRILDFFFVYRITNDNIAHKNTRRNFQNFHLKKEYMKRWPYDIIVPVFLLTLPTCSSLLFNHYDVSAMINNIWGSPFPYRFSAVSYFNNKFVEV
jgi:hypothetical protein